MRRYVLAGLEAVLVSIAVYALILFMIVGLDAGPPPA